MSWYRNFTIATKLYIGFGAMIIFAFILGITSYVIVRSVDDRYTALKDGVQLGVNFANDAGISLANARREALSMYFYADNDKIVESNLEAYHRDHTKSQDALKSILEIIAVDKELTEQDRKDSIAEVQEIIDAIDVHSDITTSLYNAIKDKDINLAKDIIAKSSVTANNATQLLSDFISTTKEDANNMAGVESVF